jgi:hypothetical protein
MRNHHLKSRPKYQLLQRGSAAIQQTAAGIVDPTLPIDRDPQPVSLRHIRFWRVRFADRALFAE